MKMKSIIQKNHHAVSFKVTCMMVITLLMISVGVKAQNVSIDLVHGSLLAAVTDENETGFGAGFKALWRHEQLALSMTGTDRDGLTATGEVLEPSAVFGEHDGNITIVGGRRPSFIVVSLPKGYRITGYTLVLANDLRHGAYSGKFTYINTNNQQTGGDFNRDGNGVGTMRFYEVKQWPDNLTNSGHASRAGSDNKGYDETDVKNIAWGTNYQQGGIGQVASDMLAQALDANNNGDIKTDDAVGKEYTITRTAVNTGTEDNPIYDMGNQLYFRLVKDYYCYGLTIKSFEIRFTAEGTFTANVKPSEASDKAVSMDASSFKTNKIDIGQMTNNTQQGTNNTAFSYVWGNVTDLDAYNYIYQDDAHENDNKYGGDVPKDCATTKNIYKVSNGGQLWYGLKNDVYYVEPPIEVENKAGNMVPIGYRIVGASINYAPGNEKYYIQLYDRTGAKITGDNGLITVDTNTPSGSKDLGLLNNDAIKFEILGSGTNGAFSNTNGMALITVDLYLQALDPYIDKMDIVCHDVRNVLSLTQTFTADNFSVAGDRFIFYVPEDYGNEDLTFTFSGLYSKYGDNTYYDGTGKGNARYSFVRSPYFITVDGDGDGGLYNNSAYSADHTYADKVYTSNAGKYRFKFNNAEDLAAAGNQTTGYLTEYPFSVSNYLTTKNPGDATAYYPIAPSDDPGTFIDCVLNASKENQKSGTYYVFTADETRWNIAPTNGWQHRYYAFYRMEIELVAKTFKPDFTWTKIYDQTLYTDDTGDKTYSMWGLTLDVQAEDGKKVEGYLTYQEILDNIQGREGVKYKDQAECDAVNAKLQGAIAAGATLTQDQVTAVNEKLGTSYTAGQTIDENNANNYNATLPGHVTTDDWRITPIAKSLKDDNSTAPASMKQILYVDGTPLYAMLNSSQNSVYKKLEDLQKELNKNSLVFLPENTTSTLDNVAYETSTTASGTGLHAGKDIVLTDKIPFFTPYKIQVDAANKATYSRLQSGPTSYALVQHATVVLPFTLTVNNGKHVNQTDDGFEFNLRTLKALHEPTNNNYYYQGEGYFELFTGSQTKANQPYMVQVDQKKSDTYSFIATQYGATIEPTPTRTQDATVKGIGIKNFKSEIEKDIAIDGGSLASYGTYSGAKVPKANNIYYFNKDRFYCSSTLTGYDDVNVRPFRAYYSPSDVTALAKMTGFSILYDLFSDDGGITTSLTETSKPMVMTISTDKGSMLINAKENIQVNILSANGVNVDAFQMNAGEQRQVNVPSGIYIVNNTKILVK
jgi:hypothetical protein